MVTVIELFPFDNFVRTFVIFIHFDIGQGQNQLVIKTTTIHCQQLQLLWDFNVSPRSFGGRMTFSYHKPSIYDLKNVLIEIYFRSGHNGCVLSILSS